VHIRVMYQQADLAFRAYVGRRVCGVANRRLDGRPDSYDEARIRERARMIPIAVDARAQHRPHESTFSYSLLAGEEDANRWDDAAREWIRNHARLNVHS